MIRIVEHNDWVVWGILISIFILITLLSILHSGANIKDFLTQKPEDSSNILPSWIMITLVNSLLLSILLSQFVPVVPKFISQWGIGGYTLNKFGFTFSAILIYYLIKNALTVLLYSCVGDAKYLKNLTLLSCKFYFLESIALIVLSFALYFYPVDPIIFFKLIISILIISLVLKNLIYFFHKQRILPEKWYYKFLYICTLQIIPVMVLWKYLFY